MITPRSHPLQPFPPEPTPPGPQPPFRPRPPFRPGSARGCPARGSPICTKPGLIGSGPRRARRHRACRHRPCRHRAWSRQARALLRPGPCQPGELAADRRCVPFQRRHPHVGVAGLQPGDRGLGRAHPRRHLGLGQPGRPALRGQVRDQPAPLGGHAPQRHLTEPRQQRQRRDLSGFRSLSRPARLLLHTSDDISNMRCHRWCTLRGAPTLARRHRTSRGGRAGVSRSAPEPGRRGPRPGSV